MPKPDPTTDNPTQDQYVLERAVTFNDGPKKSTGRIDLYKRGCFILETKQGTDSPDSQQRAEQSDRAELGLAAEKRRKGHALRGSVKWEQMMQAARQQALGYVRALPPDEPRPLFVLVVDVGYCLDVYSNFAGVGDSFVPFPDQARFRRWPTRARVRFCARWGRSRALWTPAAAPPASRGSWPATWAGCRPSWSGPGTRPKWWPSS